MTVFGEDTPPKFFSRGNADRNHEVRIDMNDQPVIATRGVTKRFGDFTAVNRVDFELQAKETLGIIGPNGAGKTTFINLLSGFYPPGAL